MNYTVNCIMVFHEADKAQDLYDKLSPYYIQNLDTRRGVFYQQPYTDTNNNTYTLLVFLATFSNESTRDTVWNIMKNSKQYCWLEGDGVENQIIQRFDTDSPTFGDEPHNQEKDHWGVDY